MIRTHKAVFVILMPLFIVISVAGGESSAAPIVADVQDGSGSIPHLNAGGNAWATFDTAQAAPIKGGLVTIYSPTDLADINAFPMQAGGATVTLRTGTASPVLNCTQVAAEPIFSESNAGQCFFWPDNDRIHLYYMGQLEAGGNIRYQISGLTPAAGAGVFQNFDSDSVLAGASPSPAAGRDPARLVLVLDKSGSMAWSSHPDDPGCNVFTAPPPGCEPARWEILNRSVTQMLAIAKAYSLPGDEFAAALFDGSVALNNRFDLTTLDPVSIDAFKVELGTRSPGGSTSIGAGVTAFESDLTGADAGDFNQVILLFTDGDQNTAPFLVTNLTQALINPTTNSPVGAGVHEFAPGLVDICPFALRADAPADTLGTTYLQDIADRRCEGLLNTTMAVDPSDPTLVQYFLEVLNNTLIGDKLELASVTSGQIGKGDTTPATEKFVISKNDPSFTLLLNWAETGNGLSGLKLTKDGVTFDLMPPIIIGAPATRPLVERGRDYVAVTLRQPFCNEQRNCVSGAGEWSIDLTPFFEVGEKFTYNLFTITDNQTLASSFRASQAQRGVGKPLSLEAVLTETGVPLTGLPNGNVKAVVARPSAGLGNVLSAAKVGPLDPPQADAISAAGLKAGAMLADPALRAQILAALEAGVVKTVTLTETDPGVYRGDFADTAVEGAYSVNFFVDADSPQNGRFLRTFETQYYVSVVPDQNATVQTVAVSSIDPCPHPGGCFAISVKPTDTAGNLLGPGKASLFTLPGFGGVQLDPVADNLDGTYTLKVGYPEGVTGKPSIDIYGVKITPDVSPRPPKAIALWVWLLIIILLLLVAVIYWSKKRHSA